MGIRQGAVRYPRRSPYGSAILAVPLVLAGCMSPASRDVSNVPDAVPRWEPLSRSGNPPSYSIAGQRYVVLASAEGFTEQGIASWYGPNFHGRRASSGETYDMYAMTAAHPTLPLPSYVQVTNLENGKQAVVRVNDRGPFKDGRVIDLSYAAARKLGVWQNGTAWVKLRAITPGEASAEVRAQPAVPAYDRAPLPPAALTGPVYVQAGAFASYENAYAFRDLLSAFGLGEVEIESSFADQLYRVRIGPLTAYEQAQDAVDELRRWGIPGGRIVVLPAPPATPTPSQVYLQELNVQPE